MTRTPAGTSLGSFALLAFHLWPGTFFFGWTRVDLFFVLSGYLITSIILRQLDQPRFLRRFWTRRALRIWPTYYVLLAFICVRASCQGNSPRLDALLEHLSFTQNVPYYWEGAVPGFPYGAQQTWSLAIEEQFYLVWPILIVLAGRAMVVPLAVWLLLSAIAARWAGLYPIVALSRCDGLALGTILAATLGDGSGKADRRGQRWPSLLLAGFGVGASWRCSALRSGTSFRSAPFRAAGRYRSARSTSCTPA